MAKKKKTMVMMPGAMTDLAHSVQKGARPNPKIQSKRLLTARIVQHLQQRSCRKLKADSWHASIR